MENSMKFDNIVFIVDGGIGKNIMATVPLRGIKKKYPNKKIHVVCGFPDIFLHNPNVDRLYRFTNTQYLCEDKIKTERALVLKREPYIEYDYLYKNKHLTEVWCEVLNVPFDNTKPDIFLTRRDLREAERFLKNTKKKVLLMHLTGGIPPQQGQPLKRMYVRDLPEEVAQIIVDELKDDYFIINIRRKGQAEFKSVLNLESMLRPLIALIPHADKLLFIDSFMQHAAAAQDREAIVLWGGTHPTCLGYESHINIMKERCKNPFCHRPNSYLFDVSPTSMGNMQVMWDCEFGDICMEHNAKEVVTVIDEELGNEMEDRKPEYREIGREQEKKKKEKDKLVEKKEGKNEVKGKDSDGVRVGTQDDTPADARIEEVDTKSGEVLPSDTKPVVEEKPKDNQPNAGDATDKVGQRGSSQESTT